jgi:hypothetical protein
MCVVLYLNMRKLRYSSPLKREGKKGKLRVASKVICGSAGTKACGSESERKPLELRAAQMVARGRAAPAVVPTCGEAKGTDRSLAHDDERRSGTSLCHIDRSRGA